MRKLKQSFIILPFFLLLIAVAATPPFVTEYQNRRLLDKPNVVTMSEEAIRNEQASSVSTVERIKMIAESNGVFTASQPGSVTEKQMESVIDALEGEVGVLQSSGAFPFFSMEETPLVKSMEKTTCMESQSPYKTVSIWEVFLEYSDYYLEVCMDAETSVIYQVLINTKNDNLQFDKNQISIAQYWKYLGIVPKKMGLSQGTFGDKEDFYFDTDQSSTFFYTCEISSKHFEYRLGSLMVYLDTI